MIFTNSLATVRASFSSSALHFGKRGDSSNQWKRRQASDIFVRLRDESDYRSRAAFKLIQMNDQEKVINPKFRQRVLDIGASPGSWSQVVSEILFPKGALDTRHAIIAVDLSIIEEIRGVIRIKGDATLPATQKAITKSLPDHKADIVLWLHSDLSPSKSSDTNSDHLKLIGILNRILPFCYEILESHGTLLCKVTRGGEEMKLFDECSKLFQNVKFIKPEASRKDSAETYLLARRKMTASRQIPVVSTEKDGLQPQSSFPSSD